LIQTTKYPLPDISFGAENRLWIYGTGEIARSYYEQLKEIRQSHRVAGFINSFGNPSFFLEKGVIAKWELRANPHDLYLVASQLYAKYMVDMLLARGARVDQIICPLDWLYGHKRDRRGIMIYQFGKVGSASVYLSLSRLGREVYHAHYLQADILTAEIKDKMNAGEEIPSHLSEILYLLSSFRKRKWDIISMVRDPLTRNISAFFQNLHIYSPSYKDRELFMRLAPEERVDRLIREFFDYYVHDRAFHWFDDQMKTFLGFDVFAHPFDRSNGYSVYEWDGHRLLLMQTERMSGLASVIGDFLGLSGFELSRDNVGEAKDYGEIYKKFRERIRFDEAYLDRMYNSRLARHFYADEDIEAFRRKWSKQP